jgi:hypothetical protein
VSDPRRDGSPKVGGSVLDRTTGEPVILPKQGSGSISDLNINGGVEEGVDG